VAEAGVVFAWILAVFFVVLVFVLGYLFPVLRPRRHIPEEASAEAESAERGRTT
jgi:preprotein translocase subunit SecG